MKDENFAQYFKYPLCYLIPFKFASAIENNIIINFPDLKSFHATLHTNPYITSRNIYILESIMHIYHVK